jgi:hypothetical protein
MPNLGSGGSMRPNMACRNDRSCEQNVRIPSNVEEGEWKNGHPRAVIYGLVANEQEP